MQFIAKVVWTNTLEIDPDGNAWYIKKFSTKLYKVDAVHDLKGYWTYESPNLYDGSDINSYDYTWVSDNAAHLQSGKEMGYADITYVRADLEGTGSEEGYLMGLGKPRTANECQRACPNRQWINSDAGRINSDACYPASRTSDSWSYCQAPRNPLLATPRKKEFCLLSESLVLCALSLVSDQILLRLLHLLRLRFLGSVAC